MDNSVHKDDHSLRERLIRRIVAITASLVFLFLLYKGWMFYSLSALKVFKKNYIGYTIRDSDSVSSAVEQAYRAKDYKQAVQLIGKSRNISDNYLAAHAELALNNPSAAIEGFKKVIDLSYVAGGSAYKDAAEYNLILSYIRNRDYDLALELMNRLKGNPGHLYHDKMTGKLFRQVKMLKWR